MNIKRIKVLTEAEKAIHKALGAVDAEKCKIKDTIKANPKFARFNFS